MATINEISSSSGLPNSQMYMECSIDYTGTNMIIGTSTLGSGLSYIYVSNNGGTTWTSTLNSTSTGWHSVSCSQNGQYMVAGNYIGQIYVSNNSGNTWTLASSTYGTYTSPSFIISLSVNNSGFILASIQFDNSNGKQNLFYSPDNGTTWYFQDLGGLGPLYIADCAISNSSTSSSIPEFMCCVTENYLGYAGGIWIYTNTTANWVNYGTDASWNSIAINNNGQYLATSIIGDSSIYVSSNYGVNSNLTNSPSGQNFGLTMNGAGNVICYYQSSGNINLSLDFGNTWQSPLNIPTSQTAIENMAINGLGNKILVCGLSKNNLTGCYIIDLQNSNPPTNYLVGGTDLSEIFQPYSGGVKASPTYYNVNGIDLCNIFDPISLGTSINFNTNIMVNGNDLKNIFAAYQQPIIYTASGNYTVYTNGIYTGIVFEYDSIFNGDASINFVNAPPYASLIMVGGGGGGIYGFAGGTPGEGAPSGGAGGGVIYYQQLQLSSSTTYNINVGQGGLGAPLNQTGTGGTESIFDTFIASGGGCTNAWDAIAPAGGSNIVNGGGGGVGCYSAGIVGGTFFSNNGGTNNNNSNIGQFVYSSTGAVTNGGASFFNYSNIPINIPFYGISAELLCGGGGGAGSILTSNGGLAGNGFGGQPSSNSTVDGQSGFNSISQGYGGGGGGGGCDSNPFPPVVGNGGNGGNGVVILYWPPYNISNSQITVQSSTAIYTPYYYNGYLGYVFNSGSGNIIFNSNVSNATLILVGGGGAGGNNSAGGNGGGGGGGITILSNSLNITSGTNLNFSIGIGGTPFGVSSTQSSFGTNNLSYNFISYGGSNGDNAFNGGSGGSINTVNGGGGGGGGCGYNFTTATYGSGGTGGTNSAILNSGSVGDSSLPQNGGNSFYGSNTFPLPFYSSTTSIFVGGGGGGNNNRSNGGLSGNGTGGDGNLNPSYTDGLGANGLNTTSNGASPGCFGGGGGGGFNTSGYGGNGVLILYWVIGTVQQGNQNTDLEG